MAVLGIATGALGLTNVVRATTADALAVDTDAVDAAPIIVREAEVERAQRSS
jgi:hypothetical protein